MAEEKFIRLGLADDHQIFRDGIKMALKSRTCLKILWEAENGKDLIHKMQTRVPDVLIMDIRMPEIDGISAIQTIRKDHEELKIIVLSMYDEHEIITKMMELGANAYLNKTAEPDEIYKAIISCIADEYYFNDLVNAAMLLKLQTNRILRKNFVSGVKFNEKELKILRLISEDKTTEEISDDVFLSPRTVETIRQSMKLKVGAKTIAGLIMYAMRNKLLERL